jgi:ribose transport system permease protein
VSGGERICCRQVGFPLVLLIVLFAGAGIVNPQFLSWDSLRIQFTLAAFIGIVGIGQTLAILIGQIDLSIPANISLSAILSANVYGQTSNPVLSLLAGAAVGLATGLLNGIGIACLRVPSLIWSLGMNLVLQGATLVYTDTSARWRANYPPLLALFKRGLFGGAARYALRQADLCSRQQRTGIRDVGDQPVSCLLSRVPH